MARWGDEPDDDSIPEEEEEEEQEEAAVAISTEKGGVVPVPPTHTSRIDSKGIKIVTSYRSHASNPAQLLKTVTKIKVTKDLVRETKAASLRRQWTKFGQAATSDGSNVTIQSRDDVYLEDPNADNDLGDEGGDLAGNLNAFWAKQQRRQLERKYDVADDPNDAAVRPSAADGWNVVGSDGKSTTATSAIAKYVPPSARGGVAVGSVKSLAAMAERAPMQQDNNRDQNTIRVTNISEDTSEAELQDLFQPFGRISRVYLAKDKETMQSRGFAFVSFVHREDAMHAMDMLQGYGYHHLILKLEWARPSAPKEPGTEVVFRSGYGKALAQDTKEKVTYASNLTR